MSLNYGTTKNLKNSTPVRIAETSSSRPSNIDTDFLRDPHYIKKKYGEPTREEIVASLQKLRNQPIDYKEDAAWTRK